MSRNGLIFAGSSAVLAGAFVLALAQSPASAPPVVAAATPDVAPAPTLATAAVPAPVAVAPAPVVSKPAPAAPAAGIVPGSAGMVIAIDPETGEVGMPSQEQLAAMKLTESDVVDHDGGGVVTNLPNGTIMLDLQGRGQEYVVIKRNADGKVVAGCTQRPEDLENLQLTPTELEEK